MPEEKAKILVVEDEAIVAKDISMCLQASGYNVLPPAASGSEAIEKAKAHRPDLILMDITLQGNLDGIETAALIHTNLLVPIVYLTAHTDEKTLNRAKISDTYGYIVKPFDEQDLKSAIEVAIARHRSDQELAKYRGDLEKSNQELDAFTHSVSHDLRTPLRAIAGFAKIMADDSIYKDLSKDAQHCLNMILSNVENMDHLIAELLNFARMGRLDLRPSKVDMNQVLQEVITTARSSLETQQVEWNIASLPEIYADRSMIRLVWQNLIENALKFSSTRDISIVVVDYELKSGDHVFRVGDNGVGFDMRYVDKLFGVFQRLHSEEEFSGTGIGLANVQRILHRHGGTCWVQSELEKGTNFFFSLPGSDTTT